MTPSLFLLLSVLVLGAGPLLGWLSDREARLLPGIDGFILGSLGGLIFLFLLPHALHVAGISALIAAAVGLVLLSAMERWAHIEPSRTHGVGILLSLAGLLLHTVVDGMAVHGGGHEHGPLAEAVIVHRLPVAVGVWWLVRPRFGRAGSLAILALLGMATLLGFAIGEGTLGMLDGQGAALFSAFVSGALTHVLFHRVAHASERPGSLHLAESGGLLLGLGMLVFLPGHGGALETYGHRFLDLALESAPAVLLGFAMAGVVVVALPQGTTRWLRRGRPWTQALKGTVFGIPIPICSCGVVPLYQGLVRKGAPPSAALAFLIATPELGVESLFLSVPLLGAKLTAARLVCALIVALAVGFIVGQMAGPARGEAEEDAAESAPVGLWAKARAALSYGLRDVVGDTAAWILAGVAVAAAVDAGALSLWMANVPTGLDVLLAAVIGLPVYVCASGATPLAAALLVAGLSPGAAVAFLLSGPATNVTTFGVLSQLHSRRVAVMFGLMTVTAAVVLGFLVNLVLGDVVAGWVHGGHDHTDHGWVAWTSLWTLAAVFLWAVLRQGPTAFLRPVLTLGDHHNDDGHDHHDHGDHGHGDHGHGDHGHGDHGHGDHGHGDHGHGSDNPKSCC